MKPKRREHVMKIFVAGATGAIGKQLGPLLLEAGHGVGGTTTPAREGGDLRALGAQAGGATTPSARNAGDVRALGAHPVVAALLDAEAVGRAVSEAAPDVVVHEAT